MKGAPLTKREQEVADLMARGRTNLEMAQSLGISPRTMDIHRTRIVEKLGARDTGQAIAMMNQKMLAEANARIEDLERKVRNLTKLVDCR